MSSVLAVLGQWVVGKSLQQPFDPGTLEQAAHYAIRNPKEQIIINKTLQEQLHLFYGTTIQQDPLKAMTGEEYISQLGHISQNLTWEKLQQARQVGESSLEALHRLRSVPGLTSSDSLYGAIEKAVIGSGSRTPWAILRYHAEYENSKMGDDSDAASLFAPQEMLAKIISYAQPEMMKPGMIVPIRYSHETVYYQIANQLHEEGLHAYFLTPIENPEAPIQLLFRGTRGIKSAYRDLDPTGIGKTVFDQCAERLIGMWKELPSRRSLYISGHSLGAVDAQRMLVALSQDPDAMRDCSFKGFFFCSPKLDQPTLEQWKPIEHCSLNFAQHDSDLCTRLGFGNIHHEGHTRYYIASSPSSTPFDLKTFHTRPLFPEGQLHPDNVSCEYISRSAPEWTSSQVLRPDSQTSFLVFQEEATQILQAWGNWLAEQEALDRLSGPPKA